MGWAKSTARAQAGSPPKPPTDVRIDTFLMMISSWFRTFRPTVDFVDREMSSGSHPVGAVIGRGPPSGVAPSANAGGWSAMAVSGRRKPGIFAIRDVSSLVTETHEGGHE